MRIVIVARDKPGHLEIRKSNRDAHLAYLSETGVVEQAGPLLDGDGQMAGSLLVLNIRDLDAAESWADGDPYNRAGLFESVMISEWNRVIEQEVA